MSTIFSSFNPLFSQSPFDTVLFVSSVPVLFCHGPRKGVIDYLLSREGFMERKERRKRGRERTAFMDFFFFLYSDLFD